MNPVCNRRFDTNLEATAAIFPFTTPIGKGFPTFDDPRECRCLGDGRFEYVESHKAIPSQNHFYRWYDYHSHMGGLGLFELR